MSNLDALRGYVQFLHEREGVREVKLSRTAREGLARLVAKVKEHPVAAGRWPADATESPSHGSRRPPGDGPPPQSSTSRPPESRYPQTTTVARNTPASPAPATDGGRRPPQPLPTASPSTPAPVAEIIGSGKVEQLRHLAERAAACVKCPHLAASRHNVVFGVGDPEARLMFVGEGPGEDEDLKGEPFVGRAGQLLTKMIQAMGLEREQVYIANILKCRPDMPPGATGNRKPTREEMETCSPYLRAQIEVIKPTVLVALGATAVEGLIGPVGSIGSLRGRFLEYRGIALMPTYHPSYLLRNQSNTEKRKVWDDLLKVMERLEIPISEKQRGYFLAK